MIPQEPNDSWSVAHTPTNHPDSRQNGRSQKGKGKERAPSPLLDMDDPMSESDETDGLKDSDEVGMSTMEEELLEEQMGDDADDESDPGYDDPREADGRNFEANDDELAGEELIGDQAAEQEPEDIDGVDPREHSASHPQSSRSTQPSGPSQKRARTQPTSRQFAVVLLDKMQQLNNSILEREERNREFQERMLDSVKALNRKVTEVQYAAPAIAKHQAKASAARRERPSRGMAARVVLEPQTSSAPMSPQEREKLLLREKRYLTKLQRVVRDHTKTLLRFTGKDYKTMVDNNPPLTDEEIEAYRASSQPSYFAQHRFRVDFTKPWGGFDFNVEARDWFVQHLLRAFQGGSYSRANIPARYRTAEHIGAALDTYIETCRDEYRRITKPPDQATMDRRKERVRRNSRKNTLYMSREEVLLKHDWTRHLELFAKLKPEFMSGDETDRDDDGRKLHPPSFTIVEPEWASIEYQPTVDGDYKGGNGPRVRNFKGKMVDSPAPKGLWRNCYNQAWVSKLKPHQLRSLSIVEEDYDFALPSEDEDSTEEEL
ncbi:hypothetical protein NUW54_g10870 [Trametes sanguinea]|uniref:Uncharacterized protein n=1 Tax=Trametes sanguinea TaxID=158606 RepID=A0ACC1NSU2_9APHY|nr:hypothetical protein NUW54_g10870 [Trametes sanguinea]